MFRRSEIGRRFIIQRADAIRPGQVIAQTTVAGDFEVRRVTATEIQGDDVFIRTAAVGSDPGAEWASWQSVGTAVAVRV